MRALIAVTHRELLASMLLDLGALFALIGQAHALAQVIEPVLLPREEATAVISGAVLLVGCTLGRAACLWAREVVGQRCATRLTSTLRRRLFVQLFSLGPGYVRGERTGELIATATDGIGRLEPYVARYLPQIALSVLGPLLIVAYVARFDLLSAALLMMTAPVIWALMVAVGSYAEGRVDDQWAELGRLRSYLLDVIQGLPTLKLFGRANTEVARVADASQNFRAQTVRMLRAVFLSSLALELLSTAGIALLAVALGLRLLNGQTDFGPAFQILILAPEFYRPLRELGAARHAAFEARPAADRIHAILERPVPAPHRAVAGLSLPTDGALEVNVVDVAYSYPDATRSVLHGVSFTLAAGTRTALVGPSGSGKTTLASLLLRFIEPGAGWILANGSPIATWPASAWRSRVAIVPQRPYLFDASALDNIRLARPSASLAEVVSAAELAGAAEFLERLPDGYRTRVGERGTRLSLGQAQRIAIARAFLKDAPLLVFDEPTSALDPESEQHLRLALGRLASGRTVLVIAHRRNTVFDADQILVLGAGRLVESGTHRQLLARGGRYAELIGARGLPAV